MVYVALSAQPATDFRPNLERRLPRLPVRREPVLVFVGILRTLQALAGLHDEAPAQPQRPHGGEEDDHDDAPDELADGELPTHQHDRARSPAQ